MKKSKKILSVVLAAIVLFCCGGTALAAEKLVTFVSEKGVYTAKKISHPYKSLGTTDGRVLFSLRESVIETYGFSDILFADKLAKRITLCAAQ